MEPNQEEIDAHIAEIVDFVATRLPAKYIIGQKEHGGRLWEKKLGPEITLELLDFMVYWYTFKVQVDKLVAAAAKHKDPELQEALKPFFYEMKKGHD